ncbi:DUF4178 domain-containing protein [Flavobacterium zepuense]|uniref:DUF4178 domain-containing protein n=1 Tax=Flavobacterium zepuense TaxID=2593302 RepID=A0A552V7G0_9FLAO|nr:DUF4178 domain-containing protein [Flavobacterium zepuense]TRW26390.1 DUF4178 domain-containing protein [Flavobacterium zepuense]
MQITCPNCKVTTTASVALDITQFACPNCNNLYSYKDGSIGKLVKTFSYKPASITLVPGQKGTLEGKGYVITGVVVKKVEPHFYWREYILTAADGKQRFLSETNGHWMVLDAITDSFKIQHHPNTIDYNDRILHLYEFSKTSIAAAKGFFDYALPLGKENLTEFINPPNILSIEKDNGIENAFYGYHVDRKTIQKGFGIPVMPLKTGTGLVEPFFINIRNLVITLSAFSILILVSQLFIYSGRYQKEVLNSSLSFSTFNNKDFVSPSFTLEGGTAPITVELQSNVDNSWAAVQVGLINEVTNEEVYATKDIEYYHGYTDGENWTEGSTADNFNICGVPAGKYHFVVTPQKPPEDAANNSVHIIAKWDKPSIRNAALPIIFMLALCIAIYYWSVSFERKRWADSSFSTYN